MTDNDSYLEGFFEIMTEPGPRKPVMCHKYHVGLIRVEIEILLGGYKGLRKLLDRWRP